MVQITKALLFVAVLAFTTAAPVAYDGMAMVAARTNSYPGVSLAGDPDAVEKRTNSYPGVSLAGDPDAVEKRTPVAHATTEEVDAAA